MRRTILRRLIALCAAYVMALHVLLPGVLAAAGGDAGRQEICAARDREPAPASVPPHAGCMACPAMCQGSSLAGVAPAGFAMLMPPAMPDSVLQGGPDSMVRPIARSLPQSRAPPAVVPTPL